jgi:hypothetical protein
MLVPSGLANRTSRRAPICWNTRGQLVGRAVGAVEPHPQPSRYGAWLEQEAQVVARRRCGSGRRGRGRCRCAASAAAASRRSSSAASSSSASFAPSGPKIFRPLSSKGLWEALTTTPAWAPSARTRWLTPGVGMTPRSTTSAPRGGEAGGDRRDQHRSGPARVAPDDQPGARRRAHRCSAVALPSASAKAAVMGAVPGDAADAVRAEEASLGHAGILAYALGPVPYACERLAPVAASRGSRIRLAWHARATVCAGASLPVHEPDGRSSRRGARLHQRVPRPRPRPLPAEHRDGVAAQRGGPAAPAADAGGDVPRRRSYPPQREDLVYESHFAAIPKSSIVWIQGGAPDDAKDRAGPPCRAR